MIQKQIKLNVSALNCFNESISIIHLLFCNLTNLLIKEPIILSEYIKNDWFRIILLASIKYTSPSYKSNIRRFLQIKKLDDQILKFIKENKSISSKIYNYKLNLIFYYVQTNLDVCSKFLIFELLNLSTHEYMRCKLFVDCLILGNNKINSSFINLFINNILKSNKEPRALIKLIPGLIETNKIVSINYQNKSELFIEKSFESLMFYAKYTKNINLFKEMLIEKELKIKFKEFIKNNWNLEKYNENIDYKLVNNLVNENNNIDILLREEYELSKDKIDFINRLEIFLNELKQ